MSSPVLLDTNALIWAIEGHERLGPDSRNIADSALREDRLFVSAISFWEVALLARRGRLTGEIGTQAAELDGLPGDPANRMITATAMAQGATLITADSSILGWSGMLVPHDARK